MDTVSDVARRPRLANGRRPTKITAREAQVFALVVARYGNAEIATSLGISKRTVESHISALLHKHNAANRMALMRMGGNSGDETSRQRRNDAAHARQVRASQLLRRAAQANASASNLCVRAMRNQHRAYRLLNRQVGPDATAQAVGL